MFRRIVANYEICTAHTHTHTHAGSVNVAVCVRSALVRLCYAFSFVEIRLSRFPHSHVVLTTFETRLTLEKQTASVALKDARVTQHLADHLSRTRNGKWK